MQLFTLIAKGIDVAPALAEAQRPELFWVRVDQSGCCNVAMMQPGRERRMEAQLPACWTLIDFVHGEAARRFGDKGRLHYARLGRVPPGAEIAPHADGYDGVRQRRYQIVLQSGPDADMIFEAERRCMLPGEAWQVHVRERHSVINPGEVERINLVFDSVG